MRSTRRKNESSSMKRMMQLQVSNNLKNVISISNYQQIAHKFQFMYNNKGALFIEGQEAKDERIREMEQKLKLLYVPKKEELEIHTERQSFTGFEHMEGNAAFRENISMSQELLPDSVDGVGARLQYNRAARRKYVSFYSFLHRNAVNSALEKVSHWESRVSKLPKVKVKSVRKLREDIKFKRSATIQLATKVLSREERKVYAVNCWFAWVEFSQKETILSREGSTFTLVGNTGWLIGGISEQVADTIWSYSTVTGTFNSHEYEEELLGPPRFNHTAVSYKNQIFIFGGEKMLSKSFDTRNTLNDLVILDPNKWEVKLCPPSREFVLPRRNHVATMIGKYMLIHGGVDQRECSIDDIWVFNCDAKAWLSLQVEGKIGSLSHHTASSIFTYPERINDLYRAKELSSKERVKSEV